MKKRILQLDKWIICIIGFLIFLGISKEICINFGSYLPFCELVLIQLNETHSVLFAMTFLLILFSAINKNNTDDLLPKKAPLLILKQAIGCTLLLIFVFIFASMFYSIINIGLEKTFTNEWTFNSGFSITGRSPFACFSIAILLFGLRCAFLFYLISLINILTKKTYWGFWSVLFICFIDFRFYNQTHIDLPLNILPIEHTRILYTRAFSYPAGIVTRVSYVFSILYWLLLILIIYEAISFIYKKRGQTT